MTAFFRFPHTPHLLWLGPGTPRNDKVLAAHEVRDLLAHEVVVEEKVDGANLGFSVGEGGVLRAQNRGSYLDLTSLSGQWKPLRHWLSVRHGVLTEALGQGLILFGEWCYAVHSLHYTCLPDWFLGFDVYDRVRAEFWNTARRDHLARRLGIAVVPRRATGRVTLEGLKRLLASSALRDGPPEGVYVRREEHGRLVTRAKLVRAEFVQGMDEHWSRRRLEVNRLTTRNAPYTSGAFGRD